MKPTPRLSDRIRSYVMEHLPPTPQGVSYTVFHDEGWVSLYGVQWGGLVQYIYSQPLDVIGARRTVDVLRRLDPLVERWAVWIEAGFPDFDLEPQHEGPSAIDVVISEIYDNL